jgi:hypothetical protein
MKQKTAPVFNFLPHLEAHQQWEDLMQIRQAQLGVRTRISRPNLFTWVMELASYAYQLLEAEGPGSSAMVGKRLDSRVNKLRSPRGRAA